MKLKFMICLLALFLTLPVAAESPYGKAVGKASAGNSLMQIDNLSYIDANNIFMFVTNHGNWGRDLGGYFGNDYGTYYPYTDTASIRSGAGDYSPYYAGGLWVGAVDSATGETRVTIAEYSDEYVPGPMSGGTYLPSGTPEFRVYKLYKDSLADNPNTDYTEYLQYAIPQGAPFKVVDGDTIPDMIGDQMCWSVFNDANPGQHLNNSGETNPLGIEVRNTTFAFRRQDPLGNIIFIRLQVYNKGNNVLKNCYLSVWSDPDLGGSGDDLVGCDTNLSLGYIYNAYNNDQYYAPNPPALGIDFFQGPLEYTDNILDTAKMWGTLWPGYRNIGMVSFNKYINGTDPDNFGESYNFMRGLNRDGSQYMFPPGSGNVLKYVASGDPVAGTGDLDIAPADRRMMQTTGPITFRPGDSTEIVAAIVIGRAIDRLTSISLLKYYDRFAQQTYDDDFEVLRLPVPPVVSVGVDENTVSLSWTDTSEIDHGSYAFEGYTIWQGESPTGPWKQIANYDILNSFEDVFDEVFDPVTAVPEIRLIKNGTNQGIKRYIVVRNDALEGGHLNDVSEYYFKVDAYTYRADAALGLKTLTASTVVSARPQEPVAGIDVPNHASSEIEAEHVTGTSGGSVTAVVVDPLLLTGDTYRVVFVDTPGIVIDTIYDPKYPYDLNYATFDSTNVAWHLEEVTTGHRLLSYQKNQLGDSNYVVLDGMMVKVKYLTFALNSFQVVANADGPLDPPEAGAYATTGFPTVLDDEGNYINPTDNQQVGDGTWLMTTADNGGSCAGGNRGSFSKFLSRAVRDGANFPFIGAYDYEMRFTGSYSDPGVNGSYTVESFNDDNVYWVPFELWQIGEGTSNDPSDDVRLIPYTIDDGDDNTFNLESWGCADDADRTGGDAEHSIDAGDNDPYTDWIYWNLPSDLTPGEADYRAYEDSLLAGNVSGAKAHVGSELFARFVLVNLNGHKKPDGDDTLFNPPVFTQDLPEVGTVFRITTKKGNTPADTFVFRVENPTYTENEKLLDKITAVPNPFYLYGGYDPTPGNYRVYFHHLPDSCTITIYNLGGDYIRKIDKKDPGSALAYWDMLTEKGLPVASGIYIYVVDAPGFGTKIGKMAVFVESEVLKIY